MQGIPSYIVPKFDFENMLDYVQKYRITELFLVPPVLVGMSNHPQVRAGRWDLSSVNSVISGAAPLGKETITDFESLWGGKIHVRQGWGLTEYIARKIMAMSHAYVLLQGHMHRHSYGSSNNRA